MGPPTRSRIFWDSWSTLQVLGPRPKSPGTDGRPRRNSDLDPSRVGQLVNTVGPRTQARVTWDIWSNPQSLGHGHKLPQISGRNCEASGMVRSRPDPLIDTASLRTWARVTQDRWSTPGAFGPKRESPGTAVQHPLARSRVARDSWWKTQASGKGLIRQGMLIDTVGPPTRSRVSRDRWSPTWALGHGPASPRTTGRPHGP